MTVKELIDKLKEFPKDMRVFDLGYDDIEDVYKEHGYMVTIHTINQMKKL